MHIRIANENDMSSVFLLRFEVFVEEQNVPPEIELDSEDVHALHIIAEENGTAVGCARVILSDSDAHIGRLAVKKTRRGEGIGADICRFIIDYCRTRGYGYIWLNSQYHAVGFYEKLGFAREGEIFEEAGIDHIKMIINLSIPMKDNLIHAHKFCVNNREALQADTLCGCFYCGRIFTPDKITEWISDSDGTAVCPYCGIDAVIGKNSGFPITDGFLSEMKKYWF